MSGWVEYTTRTSVGALIAAFLAGQAVAATDDAAAQAKAPAGSAIGEIVVTANKREESINKVGLTIKALGAAQLEQQRVTTLADLAAAVPGLNYTQTENATPVYTLRGIGFYDNALASYPAVSVYLDQAPLPFPVLTTLTLFDVERVEVLKGPQGTLFGQNATGGAINYIAAKPTQTEQAGLNLTYARFNTFSGDGFVSGPITDNLLARLAVSATSGDGWQRSISRPNDKNGAPDTFAARFLTDWRPTDRLRIQTNLNGWRDRTEPSAAQFVQFVASQPVTIPSPIPNQPMPNAVNNPRLAEWSPETHPRADDRLLQATTRIDYDVTDDIVFTSLTSYIDYKHNEVPEGDGVVQHRNDLTTHGNIRSFSQEIRLANNNGKHFRWTVGANYSHDKVFDWVNVESQDSTTHYSPFFPDNIAHTGTPGGWNTVGSSSNQVMRNYAGFASAEYTLGQFTLKGGARYTQADRRSSNCTFALNDDGQTTNPENTFFQSLSEFITGNAIPTPQPGDCLSIGPTGLPQAITGKLNEHNVSWRGGIDWKPSSTLLVYLNVAKGYKAGSFPTIAGGSSISYTPVKQESVLTYEGGIKAQLFDHRLSLNAAAFYSDYKNKQIKSKLFDPLFNYLQALVNVPKSRIQGFEVEANARPLKGLTIGGGVTYLDTKIKNSVGPDGNFLITLDNQQTNSAGNPIPYASKWTATGNLNYTFTINDGMDAFVGAQVMHRTKTNSSIGDEAILGMPGYTTLDLQAGLNLDHDKYGIMVWGKNVTNEFYLINRNFTFDGVGQFMGRPATYGVTLSAKF
jgi:outer membrane receptor protein involved in Fe transport